MDFQFQNHLKFIKFQRLELVQRTYKTSGLVQKNIWQKYCFGNILGKSFFSKIFGNNSLFKKNYPENILGENIFQKNIFGKNIFGNGIFFGKRFDFPSLLSTPNIQLPPPLTSYLKSSVTNERRTHGPDAHTHCLFYCIRYN